MAQAGLHMQRGHFIGHTSGMYIGTGCHGDRNAYTCIRIGMHVYCMYIVC